MLESIKYMNDNIFSSIFKNIKGLYHLKIIRYGDLKPPKNSQSQTTSILRLFTEQMPSHNYIIYTRFLLKKIFNSYSKLIR